MRGHVQGVYFRVETQTRALQLGLAGWVRNMPDGSVEAVFEGPNERLELVVEWCRRGPRGAHVTSLDLEWEEPTGERAFRILE